MLHTRLGTVENERRGVDKAGPSFHLRSFILHPSSFILPRALWVFTLAVSMSLGVGGQLLMKYGLRSAPGARVSGYGPALLWAWIGSHPLVLVGLMTYCMGTLFWLVTVSRVDLSFVYPLTSLNFVLILAASYLFFGEAVSWGRIAGVAAIVFGVVLVTYKESAQHVSHSMDPR